MVQSASAKLAKIHFAKQRWERLDSSALPELVQTSSDIPMPMAVELPGDMPMFPPHPPSHTPPSRQSYESGADSLAVPGGYSTPSPRSSGERLQAPTNGSNHHSPRLAPAAPAGAPPLPPQGRVAKPPTTTASGRGDKEYGDSDRLVVNAPTPAQYRYASGADKIAIMSPEDQPRWYQDPMAGRPTPAQKPLPTEPPPLPPKTPLPENQARFGRGHGAPLPYPLEDEAPPVVNMAKKPNYSSR